MEMTKAALKKICKEVDGCYSTASLNDKLYLQYKGFYKIANLEEYTGLKCVWLEGNGLQDLTGLEACTQLRTIYAAENCIEKMQGLETLGELRTLNLSKNIIGKIEGIDKCTQLDTLLVAHNRLQALEDIEHVTLCPALTTLDMQSNHVEDPAILEILKRMPNLRVLYMQGNPVVKKIKYYRKTLTAALPELRYLDDRPVFPEDRLRAEAWQKGMEEGGLKAAQAAERAEIKRQREEKKAKEQRDFEAFGEMIKEAKRKKAVSEAAEAEAAAAAAAAATAEGQEVVPDTPAAEVEGGETLSMRRVRKAHAEGINPFSGEPIVRDVEEDPKLKEAREKQLSEILGEEPPPPPAPAAPAAAASALAPPLPPTASPSSASAPAQEEIPAAATEVDGSGDTQESEPPPLEEEEPSTVESVRVEQSPEAVPAEEGETQNIMAFLDAFLFAQARENAGDEQGAAEVYLDILSDAGYEGLAQQQWLRTECTLAKKWSFSSRTGFAQRLPDAPPDALIVSCCLNAMGGLFLEDSSPTVAACLLRAALEVWPENAMALVNLAHLEREHGSPKAAIKIYERVEYFPAPEGNDWAEYWISEPSEQCAELSAYTLALLHHQMGDFRKGLHQLRRFDVKLRVHPAVWAASAGRGAIASAGGRLLEESGSSPCPCRELRGAVPEELLKALRVAFQPSSPFWAGTDYKNRGYFSFWYDFDRRPSNLVELLIRSVAPLTGNADICGAEWWVHHRPEGRNLGHQLHFDTDEATLIAEKKIIHPAVSSVLYLSGSQASPTIVFDQKVDDTKPGEVAFVASGEPGNFLLFPGNLLHGVLPGKDRPGRSRREAMWQSGDEAPQRLTLLIGFWTTPVGSRPGRSRLGPCAPLPHRTRSTTWPNVLDIPPTLESRLSAAAAQAVAAGARPTSVPLKTVAPAWDVVQGDNDNGENEWGGQPLEIPVSVDQRFFIRSPVEFHAHLVQRAIGCES
eukprot:g3646.t1